MACSRTLSRGDSPFPPWRAHFTVYAPDVLGIGFSDRVPELDCGMRASAQRMIEFLDALGLREFDLVGTSHGGALATIMAAEMGKRVRRLVLVAPVNPWSPPRSQAHSRAFQRAGGWLFSQHVPAPGSAEQLGAGAPLRRPEPHSAGNF